MYLNLCLIFSICSVLNAVIIPVTDILSCDSVDETKIYVLGQQGSCVNSKCNLAYRINPTFCVADTTCFGTFTCSGGNVVAPDGSVIRCDANSKCNNKFKWPCTPCVCSTEFTCDPTNAKVVNIMKPIQQKMLCTDNRVCNTNTMKSCELCVTNGTGTGGNGQRPEPNCNDGNGISIPCRRSNDGNRQFYYRCKPVWYWLEYERMSCALLNSDSVCNKYTGLC